MPAPMPREPPVTRATLSFNERTSDLVPPFPDLITRSDDRNHVHFQAFFLGVFVQAANPTQGRTTKLGHVLIHKLADAVRFAFFCLRRLRSRVLTRPRMVWK